MIDNNTTPLHKIYNRFLAKITDDLLSISQSIIVYDLLKNK